MVKFSTLSRLMLSSLAVLLGLTACSTMPGQSSRPVSTSANDGPPLFPVDVSQLKNAVPKKEPKCAFGNPSSYTVAGKTYYVMNSAKGYSQIGTASWYGTKFHGKLTSSLEPYDMLAMTAASPVLPIPTYVKVTNLENGKQIIVKVNDRGPFANNRIMDLSYAAAKKLGYTDKGTARVKVEAITFEDKKMLANKQLYLQIGSFHQMAKAEEVKVKIAQLTHYNARIQTLNLNDKTLYRVQIGPIENVKKTYLITTLHRKGYTNPIVILS